jgi:hypothetical protein
VIVIGLLVERDSAIVIGDGVFRIELDGLAIGRDRAIEIALLAEHQATAVERGGKLRSGAQRLVEIRKGTIEIAGFFDLGATVIVDDREVAILELAGRDDAPARRDRGLAAAPARRGIVGRSRGCRAGEHEQERKQAGEAGHSVPHSTSQ